MLFFSKKVFKIEIKLQSLHSVKNNNIIIYYEIQNHYCRGSSFLHKP